MKLYVYTPIGHRANSYFVMANSEVEASEAIVKLIRERNDPGFSEKEFMLRCYNMDILHQNEVFSVRNDL